MVYRLHRASKFLRIRLFAVLLIYALIIGAIGLFLLNFVVLFDIQSFTPQLIDENATSLEKLKPNFDENLAKKDYQIIIEGCDSYKAEECNWYLFNDFKLMLERRGYIKDYPNIPDLAESIFRKELLVVKENPDDIYKLVTTKLILSSAFPFSSTFETPNINQFLPATNENKTQYCFSLESGSLCDYEKITGFDISIEKNLRYYNTNLNNSYTQLLARVLIDNNNNQILCRNVFSGCQYSPIGNLTDENYAYFNVDKTSGDVYQKDNVSAFEAFISPEITQDGVIHLNTDNIICNINSGGCNDVVYYKDDQGIGNRIFVFRTSDNIFVTGTLELRPATVDNELILPIEKIPNTNFPECYISYSNTETNFLLAGDISLECSSGFGSDTGVVTNSYDLVKNPLSTENSPATENTKIAFSLDPQQT